MKVIWALYDDANGSWHKISYKFKDILIISIGINDNYWPRYHLIDLSITNKKLNKDLNLLVKKYGSPDAIVASPPCESWSIADNQRRCYRGFSDNNFIRTWNLYNLDFYNNNNNIVTPNMYRDFYSGIAGFVNGLTTAYACEKIIRDYNPKIWIIENPQSSKIWEILNIEGIKNNTYYNNWDEDFTKKPTTFLSNIDLGFPPRKNIKNISDWDKFCGYNKRSAIPHELIVFILEKMLTIYKSVL